MRTKNRNLMHVDSAICASDIYSLQVQTGVHPYEVGQARLNDSVEKVQRELCSASVKKYVLSGLFSIFPLLTTTFTRTKPYGL